MDALQEWPRSLAESDTIEEQILASFDRYQFSLLCAYVAPVLLPSCVLLYCILHHVRFRLGRFASFFAVRKWRWFSNEKTAMARIHSLSLCLYFLLLVPIASMLVLGILTCIIITPTILGVAIIVLGIGSLCLLFAILHWRTHEFRATKVFKTCVYIVLFSFCTFELITTFLHSPFTFTGISAIFLGFNMIPISYIVFLNSSARKIDFPQFLDRFLTMRETDRVNVDLLIESMDVESAAKRRITTRIAYVVALAVLVCYVVCVTITAQGSVGLIGVVNACILVVIDMIFFLWLRLTGARIDHPTGLCLVMGACRACLCLTLQYWFLADCLIYLLLSMALSYRIIVRRVKIISDKEATANALSVHVPQLASALESQKSEVRIDLNPTLSEVVESSVLSPLESIPEAVHPKNWDALSLWEKIRRIEFSRTEEFILLLLMIAYTVNVIVARYVSPTGGSEGLYGIFRDTTSQFVVAYPVFLLSVAFFFCFLTVRLYRQRSWTLNGSMLLPAIIGYSAIIGIGIFMDNFVANQIPLFCCIFLPPAGLCGLSATVTWSSNDYQVLEGNHTTDGGAWNALFKGKLVKQDYIVIANIFFATSFIAALGFVTWLVADPPWIGYSIALYVYNVCSTVLAFIGYFKTFSIGSFVVVNIILASVEHVVFCVLLFIFQFDSKLETSTAALLAWFIFYPVIILLLAAVLKWKDDSWKMNLFVKTVLSIVGLILLAFGIVLCVTVDPSIIGVGIILLFLCFCCLIYLIEIWRQNRYFLPYAYYWYIYSMVLVAVGYGFLTAFVCSDSGRAFRGFSISWFALFGVASCFAIHKQYVLETNIGYYIYSPYIFPVYHYDPTIKDLRLATREVAVVYLALFLALFWGILATIFIEPAYAGLCVTSVSMCLIVIFTLQKLWAGAIIFGKEAKHVNERIIAECRGQAKALRRQRMTHAGYAKEILGGGSPDLFQSQSVLETVPASPRTGFYRPENSWFNILKDIQFLESQMRDHFKCYSYKKNAVLDISHDSINSTRHLFGAPIISANRLSRNRSQDQLSVNDLRKVNSLWVNPEPIQMARLDILDSMVHIQHSSIVDFNSLKSKRDALVALLKLDEKVDMTFKEEVREIAHFQMLVVLSAASHRHKLEKQLLTVLREMGGAWSQLSAKDIEDWPPTVRDSFDKDLAVYLENRKKKIEQQEMNKKQEIEMENRRQRILKQEDDRISSMSQHVAQEDDTMLAQLQHNDQQATIYTLNRRSSEHPQEDPILLNTQHNISYDRMASATTMLEQMLLEDERKEKEKKKQQNETTFADSKRDSDYVSICQECIKKHICTFTGTGTVAGPQRHFRCISCGTDEEPFNCCTVCITVCHKGHQLEEGEDINVYCECGSNGLNGCRALMAIKDTDSNPSQSIPAIPTATWLRAESAQLSTDHSIKKEASPLFMNDMRSSMIRDAELVAQTRRQLTAIKQKSQGQPWIDTEFPPSAKSIFMDGSDGSISRHPEWSQCKWLRAREFCATTPQVFRDGIEPKDINQGKLGDCWFLSALSVLATRPDDLKRVFHPDCMSFNQEGIYAMRFYKNGKPRIVIVDEFFPCEPTNYNNNTTNNDNINNTINNNDDVININVNNNKKKDIYRPVFSTMGELADGQLNAELWVMLLEKAYAKLHRSYEAIEGGFVDQALVDLTGGASEHISFDDAYVREEIANGFLWKRLLRYYEMGYLLGCGSHAGSDANVSQRGIVENHAYAVLEVRQVYEYRLIQLRNPWGQTSWKGDWSLGSPLWTKRMRSKIRPELIPEGSFWMSFEDFLMEFSHVYVCRLFSDQWIKQTLFSAWYGKTAGGCGNYESFGENPQFLLTVTKPTNIFISLAQEESRGTRKQDFAIGFKIYDNNGKRVTFEKRGEHIASNPQGYFFMREVSMELSLTVLPSSKPYTLVCSTYNPEEECEFMLTVYSDAPVQLSECLVGLQSNGD
eukprot:GILK01012038.1.p1 GENE.GILK01012038.1~~GILK01012038.1.p1  ORF type:complete len:1948 (-),score=270.98 GILK01012038.1:81-5924(-)